MKIAIIGGIGSGKSEVLRIAEDMGLNTLSADEINSRLLDEQEYIARISEAFPTAVVGGKIDRKILADIVFSDKSQLAKLNGIAHPEILKRINGDGRNPLVVEMPLMFEIGVESMFDTIILVHTPLLKRLGRLKGRGVKTTDALRRMRAQTSERRLKKIADRTIDNSSDITTLRDNAVEVFKEIIYRNGI